MRIRWAVALFGLFLATFSLLALSGPGRIDIVDGQTRYEVARSLVDHGDSAIRNAHVWFGAFPGAGGRQFTYYRFPQSVLGVPAIWIADALGERSEERRQFCFVLVSAVAGAALAVVFATAFRDQGLNGCASLLGGFGGILCTPCWYYSTSTFDEIFGTLAVVALVVAAMRARVLNSTWYVAVASLLIAFAINCKQPLGAFALLALGIADDSKQPVCRRLTRAALLLGGVALGGVLHFGYYWLKFPPGETPDHSALLKQYAPNFPGQPLPAIAALLLSPGAGVFWYAPAILLTAIGWREHWRQSPTANWCGLIASLSFVGFIACLTIFKGDVAWGPRYLTPLIALGWLLVPAGLRRAPRVMGVTVLVAAVAVQILAVSVDPHRLYLERGLRGAIVSPQLCFNPQLAHLVQRPREIGEVFQVNAREATAITPSWSSTSAPPVLEQIPVDSRGPHQYVIFDTFRPWWVWQQWLPEDQRPVNLSMTVWLLSEMFALGVVSLILASRGVNAL